MYLINHQLYQALSKDSLHEGAGHETNGGVNSTPKGEVDFLVGYSCHLA